MYRYSHYCYNLGLIKLNNIIRITFCVPHQSMLHFLSLPQLESLTLWSLYWRLSTTQALYPSKLEIGDLEVVSFPQQRGPRSDHPPDAQNSPFRCGTYASALTPKLLFWCQLDLVQHSFLTLWTSGPRPEFLLWFLPLVLLWPISRN